MKALVTGATGFIGSHLVELLLKKKYAVRVLLRTTSDTVWLKDLPIEYAYGNLLDTAPLAKACEGVDSVFHLAGQTKAKTREEYIRANTEGTKNLLDAAVRSGGKIRRFVLVSSQTAAGPSPGKAPITEDAAPHPITAYGESKWMAEQACLARRSEIPVTIVRPPVVYGPRDKDVFEFFHTLAKGLQPMVGLKEKYVSMVYVADLVRGTVMAAESEKAVGGTYFIASKDVYGWKEIGDIARAVLGTRALRVRIPGWGVYAVAGVAELLASFSAKPALINFEKARDMVQNCWTCDSGNAKTDFGYEQEVSLEEGIRETIRWYREKGWL